MEEKAMKLFNFVVILLIIFLAFCTNKEKETKMTPETISESDTVLATLNYTKGFLPESPFRIDSIVVKKNKHLRFLNTTDYNATFIIPNSDKLFYNNKDYASLTDSLSNVQYLFIPISANDKSNIFKIHPSANPDSINAAIYPFSAFCKNGTVAAERNSSPIIIVDPGQ